MTSFSDHQTQDPFIRESTSSPTEILQPGPPEKGNNGNTSPSLMTPQQQTSLKSQTTPLNQSPPGQSLQSNISSTESISHLSTAPGDSGSIFNSEIEQTPLNTWAASQRPAEKHCCIKQLHFTGDSLPISSSSQCIQTENPTTPQQGYQRAPTKRHSTEVSPESTAEVPEKTGRRPTKDGKQITTWKQPPKSQNGKAKHFTTQLKTSQAPNPIVKSGKEYATNSGASFLKNHRLNRIKEVSTPANSSTELSQDRAPKTAQGTGQKDSASRVEADQGAVGTSGQGAEGRGPPLAGAASPGL